MAPTRLQLQNQSQRSNETFKEYAQHWREMASRVQPALSDNELVDIFRGTLQGLYFEKMIGSSSTNLSDMVIIGEHVESGLKSGKITYTTAQQTTNKRPHGGFAKKKEGEANAMTAKARPRYQFSDGPYDVLSISIRHRSLISASFILVPTAESHNPNSTSAFHARYIGHSIEDCLALKKRIQELIDQEILSFFEEKPNVKTNPLPNHSGAAVNAVIKEETVESILRVEELKGCVQELMDQGLIQFSKPQAAEEVTVIEPIIIVYRKKKVEAPPKRIQPIHFRVPTPFPYQNTKAVPWNYETTTYLVGKEIRIPDTKIINIARTGGMTQSGRVFAPNYTPRVSPTPTFIPPKEKVIDNKAAESETSKGKGPMVEKEQIEDHMKSITFEESQEFLKLIKKSDFKIVDQLNQTPSKISILSLLLSSEAHLKALLKVLNTAHVMQDITVDQFDDVVANIIASRYLGFNEAELPLEGNAHNKALHISVTCTDSLLSRVLADTSSLLNVLPKSTLSQL
ncbi:uncharacterized protein LOC127100414 [Lathyrus oleraceus]|uniref:uncharacterized protein LOC127100414 n=1 Tax=Pisum sativum TaxID=3888 RepID=UPI0021D36264|nr:uncharacterized protein LOC127100414 [Pisum sativum]